MSLEPPVSPDEPPDPAGSFDDPDPGAEMSLAVRRDGALLDSDSRDGFDSDRPSTRRPSTPTPSSPTRPSSPPTTWSPRPWSRSPSSPTTDAFESDDSLAAGLGVGGDGLLVLVALRGTGAVGPVGAAVVGAVEAGALEHDAGTGEHLAQHAAARRALGEGVVGERLLHLDALATRLAGVFVLGHSGPQTAGASSRHGGVPASIRHGSEYVRRTVPLYDGAGGRPGLAGPRAGGDAGRLSRRPRPPGRRHGVEPRPGRAHRLAPPGDGQLPRRPRRRLLRVGRR